MTPEQIRLDALDTLSVMAEQVIRMKSQALTMQAMVASESARVYAVNRRARMIEKLADELLRNAS